jgi:hypothetical protein
MNGSTTKYGRLGEVNPSSYTPIDGLPTEHAEQLKTLMTLKFQQFKDVSLMAA